jgi:drug/metabolite transporter (DMT)-like permease
VLAASMWGLWPLWARDGSGGAPTAAIAQGVAGVVTLPWALWAMRRRPNSASVTDIVKLIGVGLCNGTNTWLYLRALNQGATAAAVLAHYLAPVLVALAAPVVLREPRSPRTPVALGLALAGTAALLLAGPRAGADFAAVERAVLFGAGSAVFYASATLLAKQVGWAVSDAELFSYQALVGSAMTLPFVALPALGVAWLRPCSAAIVSTVAPGLLFYAGLRRLPAERAGVLSYLEVVGGVMTGWIAFGEPPGAGAIVGGVCILAAGLWVMTAPRPRDIVPPRATTD